MEKLCYISSVSTLAHKKDAFANEQLWWEVEQDNSDYAIDKHIGEMQVW